MSERLTPGRLAEIRDFAERVRANKTLECLAHIDTQQAEMDRLVSGITSLEVERDRLAGQVSALREALEDIRHSMPYPRDWKGQKLDGMAWSMPPSTERELRRLVGDPTSPSQLLADTEADAKARDQRMRLEGALEYEGWLVQTDQLMGDVGHRLQQFRTWLNMREASSTRHTV